MTKKHLIIMDPVEKLNLKLDSSLRIAYELDRMTHEVYVCQQQHLSHFLGEMPKAHAAKISFPSTPDKPQLADGIPLFLTEFSSILMRKDPPFDLAYIATTWLLDYVKDKVLILNHPQALRDLNEKLMIFHFPEASLNALVSHDSQQLLEFAKRTPNREVVIKPLNLYGGQGVERLSLRESASDVVLQAIDLATYHGKQPVIMQAFNEAIYEGEVRVFTAFGEPVAWCAKRPKSGSFLANTGAGASLLPHIPSEVEIERVTRVAGALVERGVMLVGFDLIGGYISEINITSPRLLEPPGDRTNYYRYLAEAIIKNLN